MTDVLSPRDAALAGFASTLDNAFDASRDEIGAIAKIACAIVTLVNSGNGDGVTLTIGGKSPRDVYIDGDTLALYARGELPREADADLPRAADVLAAFQLLSPKIGKAQVALADANEKLKGMAKRERAIQSADIDRLSRMLNTVKQPIRRGAKLAAYVLTFRGADAVPYYDPASVEAKGGVLYATPHATVDDADPAREDLSLALAEDYFAKPKAPKASTANAPRDTSTGVISDAAGDAQAVTVNAESVRKGGTHRAKLADALKVLAGFVSDIDGAPDHNEREAMIRLYVALERHFDDDSFAKVADERDRISGE